MFYNLLRLQEINGIYNNETSMGHITLILLTASRIRVIANQNTLIKINVSISIAHTRDK